MLVKRDKIMNDPIRPCVGCGSKGKKNELVRITLSKEKKVMIDKGTTFSGRGAYLHKSDMCLNQAIKKNMFARRFRQHIPLLAINLFRKEFMIWITNRKS